MDKDFVRDQNPTPIYHAHQMHGLPDYVKTATEIQPKEIEGLHSSAFADRINKLHPIHNKVAALMSGIYLAGYNEKSGPIWTTVKEACDYYGVGKDLEDIITVFDEEPVKSASTVSVERDYAIQIKWNDEETGSYYPIKTAAEVAESAVLLDKDYFEDRMPVEVFRAAASNIMKAAAEKGVYTQHIPRTVSEAGTARLPNLDYADLMLYTRKEAGVPDEGMQIYQQCLDIAKEAQTDQAIEQAVSLWRDLDEQHGITYTKKANGRWIPSPQECFYTGMTEDELKKTAQEHVVLCGVMIPKNDFLIPTLANDYANIRREFGKEASAQVIDALTPLSEDNDKSASDTSNNLADLEDWQQKRVLQIVTNYN